MSEKFPETPQIPKWVSETADAMIKKMQEESARCTYVFNPTFAPDDGFYRSLRFDGIGKTGHPLFLELAGTVFTCNVCGNTRSDCYRVIAVDNVCANCYEASNQIIKMKEYEVSYAARAVFYEFDPIESGSSEGREDTP